MRFGIIPFLLLIIPVLEIAVFILVGGEIGLIATLAMILFTAILGSILLRIQGFSTINRLQAQASRGEVPGRELANGAMILVAGVLLLTPGFITDGLGFLLFVPAFRDVVWSAIASRVIIHAGKGFRPHPDHRPGGDNVVDLDEDEFSEKPNPDSPWISGNDPEKRQ